MPQVTPGENTDVAVVHQNQAENSRLLAPTKLGPCCAVEPVRGITVDLTVVHQCEVPSFTQAAKECLPVAGAIGIIHLDEPVLVADGDDEISVICGIYHGVGVGPVRKVVGMSG